MIGLAANKIELAHGMFIHAARLNSAARIIGQQAMSNPKLFIPYVVLASLVFELYLKCLAVLEAEKPKLETHDYVKLFDQLSEPSKDRIKASYEDNPSPVRQMVMENKFPKEFSIEQIAFVKQRDFSFEATLGRCKNAFANYRYIHEQWYQPRDERQYDFSVNAIVQGVIEAIKEKQPLWFEEESPPSWL